MIKNWKHKGLKNFFETGSNAGIQSRHAKLLRLLLFQLASAARVEDMNTPGNGFHKLTGNLEGYYALKINKNWRLVYRFIGEHAYDVDYIDYH